MLLYCVQDKDRAFFYKTIHKNGWFPDQDLSLKGTEPHIEGQAGRQRGREWDGVNGVSMKAICEEKKKWGKKHTEKHDGGIRSNPYITI